MTDYELISSGTFSNYIAYRKYQFLAFDDYDNETYGLAFSNAEDSLCDISPEDFERCVQLFNNNRSRCSRLRKKIEKMLKCGSVYFLTLTFRDSVLENTSEQTRRDYIRRFLDSYGFVYVANVDYGGKFGREHYHAVCCSKNPLQLLQSGYHYSGAISDDYYNHFGFCDIRPVINVTSSSKAISKYIAKLSNHALKDSTKEHSLIYSRKKPSWFKFN